MRITDKLTYLYSYVLIGNGRSLLFYNIKTVSYKVHSVDLKNDGIRMTVNVSLLT